MPRTALNKLIPKGDYLLVRAFPKVAQHLESKVHDMDKAEVDAYLKLIPGAIDRFQSVTTATNDLHESVQVAIVQLVASFKPTSFESQTVSSDDPALQYNTRNTLLETGESVDGDSDSELPNGSDTDQSVASSTLPHNDLQASAGNGGEPDSPQERPRNARVRTASKLGRRPGRRAQQASGESADDRGRLSGP